MLKSIVFIALTTTQVILLVLFYLLSPGIDQSTIKSGLAGRRELVRQLQLTDFAVWTEARYTRHPSQSDFFSPFQDFPSSFEHFPAGSIMAPVFTQEAPAND